MNDQGIQFKAIYKNYKSFISALKLLVRKDYKDIEVFSPMPLHDVQKLLPQNPSGVRWFAFLGGLIGLVIGFAFPIYTVLQWPLITGGKPVVTIQAFIIIAFELLILFGAIFTLFGLLFHARIPRQRLRNYDERFSENSYGMILTVKRENSEDVKKIFNDADDLIVTH